MQSMNPLIQKLEIALLSRNPALADRLRPSLPVEKIRKDLKRAGITGSIDPIVQLYAWKDGTNLQGESATVQAAFTPPMEVPLSEDIKQALFLIHGVKRETDMEAYHFPDLKWAILQMRAYKSYAQHNPKLSVLVGRYFPFLWNGSNNEIALDLEPSGHNRVVTIRTQDEQPLREAYDSFEEFLQDAIRANETSEPLSCLLRLGKPIVEASDRLLQSQDKAAARKTGRIPETEDPLVLRTDFSDDAAWKSLCEALQDPDDEFTPSLAFVSDPAFDGLTAAEMPAVFSDNSSHVFAFIVDRTALTHSAHPILAIDLHNQTARTFRVTAVAFREVANNLSIANMDFDDFARAVDKDGIFHGFKQT